MRSLKRNTCRESENRPGRRAAHHARHFQHARLVQRHQQIQPGLAGPFSVKVYLLKSIQTGDRLRARSHEESPRGHRTAPTPRPNKPIILSLECGASPSRGKTSTAALHSRIAAAASCDTSGPARRLQQFVDWRLRRRTRPSIIETYLAASESPICPMNMLFAVAGAVVGYTGRVRLWARLACRRGFGYRFIRGDNGLRYFGAFRQLHQILPLFGFGYDAPRTRRCFAECLGIRRRGAPARPTRAARCCVDTRSAADACRREKLIEPAESIGVHRGCRKRMRSLRIPVRRGDGFTQLGEQNIGVVVAALGQTVSGRGVEAHRERAAFGRRAERAPARSSRSNGRPQRSLRISRARDAERIL